MYPNIFNYYKLHALTVATLCPGPANILAQVCSTITRQPIRARNLFKLSTDSARLVVEIKKKKNLLWVWGSLGETSQVWGVFAFFWPTLRGPGRQSHESIFSFKILCKTRLSSQSLELSIAFLAYLEPKLCHKNQKVVKISTPTKGNLG